MKKGSPHPKTLRPDVTYPSPDPTREPLTIDYKIGDTVFVKPNIFYQGYDLGDCSGTIVDIESYLQVSIYIEDPLTHTIENKTFPLTRYEVELGVDEAILKLF